MRGTPAREEFGFRISPVLVLLGLKFSLWAPSEASAQGPRNPRPWVPTRPGSSPPNQVPPRGPDPSPPDWPPRDRVGPGNVATSGPESVFWNPAGLAQLEGGGFFVYRGNHLVGDATGFSLVLSRQPLGTVGISYQLLDLGGQELKDQDNNVIGSFSVRDHLAIVSFGMQVLPRWTQA